MEAPFRTKSLTPNSSSRPLICWVTAGWETPRSCAAAVKVPDRTAAWNIRICVRFMS